MDVDSSSDAKENTLNRQQQEEWANCLVGRWWEVYWDPGQEDEKNSQEQMKQPAKLAASTHSEPVATEAISPVESVPQSLESKPSIQELNVLYTGTRLGLSLLQIHIPNTAATDPSMLDKINQYRTIRNQTAPYSYVAIKALLPDAANSHLLQVGDIITGINGNSFYTPEFQQAGYGGDFFNRVVSQLRDAKRPMIVNFERVVLPNEKVNEADATSVPLKNNLPGNYRKPSDKDLEYPAELATELPSGWTLRRIPRSSTNNRTSDIYYFSPQENFKFRSRPEVSRFLDYLQQTNGNEAAAISLFRDQANLKSQSTDIDDVQQSKKRPHESDGSEEEEECDAVDWYDAKILSYNNGEFVVYFLGDDEGVTYTMPLTQDVVRPSVRLWATRTRALLGCNLDLSQDDEYESWAEKFTSLLPPSTELPGDIDAFEVSYGQESDRNEGVKQKVRLYKRMVALQLNLSKRISPTNDEMDGVEEEEQSNGPGPFINAVEVNALCRYLNEAQKACDWLLSEDITWSILKFLTSADSLKGNNGTMLTKEAILSFLVTGARVIHRLLRADPSLVRKTAGRKKRRLDAIDSITVDGSFDLMLQSALFSDTTIDTVMASITTQYLERNSTKCIDCAVRSLVNQAYDGVWKPILGWIKTADDMLEGRSQSKYSIGDMESHISVAESSQALHLIDVSSWTVKLEAKLSRLQFFEMETWSAIKACIQLNVSRESITSSESVNVVGSNDSCYAALQRLKRESVVLPIKNINPLGKTIVTPDGILPSPLTRSVIDDAITIRLWVLDLMQAKLLRERSSFIEDVIRRFSALPKLPTPPFGGFDGREAQPSAVLAENTKDSITILSANCYSYTHIIGNIGANLRSSMNVLEDQSASNQLTTKSGVAASLVELKRLPILSVVEEKLCLRDELIDWTDRAKSAMEKASSAKLPYEQMEELYNELVNIVDLRSQSRIKLCQNLRTSKSVDSEVRLFAIDDEKVICSVAGAWVRKQYTKASEWKKTCESIIQALEANGFFSEEAVGRISTTSLIDVGVINQVWDQHNDNSFASSIPEFQRLTEVKQKIIQWSSDFARILTAETLSLHERCNQLDCLKKSRPRGITIEPSSGIVDLWMQLYSWPLSTHEQIKLLTKSFEYWKASDQPEPKTDDEIDAELMSLLNTNLGTLLFEGGQVFLFSELSPELSRLRDDAIKTICRNSCSSPPQEITMKRLMSSTPHAKAALNHIFDMKADIDIQSSMVNLRVMFWKIMVKDFLWRMGNDGPCANTDIINLPTAKALLSLCPRSSICVTDIVQDKSKEEGLQSLVKDAEELQVRANAVLSHASELLRGRCISRKDELNMSLEGLLALHTDFKSNPSVSLMLRSSGIESRLAQKVKALQWLLKTMMYPILWDDSHVENNVLGGNDCRISLNSLVELHLTIPQHSELCELDAEVSRMGSLVTNLVDTAKAWQESLRVLQENGPNKIVELSVIKTIDQASILSMVALPGESTVNEIFKNALAMKESIETKLLTNEKPNSFDVYKGKFPNEESLVGDDGDFLLFRLTGSLIYIQLRRALTLIKPVSDELTVRTAEKAAYQWMMSVSEWIEMLSSGVICDGESQLSIPVDNARNILEQGRSVLYSVPDEVQDSLAMKQISIRPKPNKYSIVVLKGGAMTSPGGSLLRWAALLFEGLRSDVKKESVWRANADNLINSFSFYEQGGKNISSYIEQIKLLVEEAKSMFVRDGHVVRHLLMIIDNVMKSEVLKRHLDNELESEKKKRFDLERVKYEGPPLVDERYNLLDSLVFRASSAYEEEESEFDADNVESLFAGEQSSRDKSRHFLQKSLIKGFEIFGLDRHQDSLDYSNVLAWNLEQAIFDKFKTDETNTSNEYREKVRSLRFNLQDPKNPMLCARVLSGQLKFDELINMTSDELASKELNDYRQQVQQEATRNIVLAGPVNSGSNGIPGGTAGQSSDPVDNNWARRVKIESPTMKIFSPESTGSQSFGQQSVEPRAALHVPPPPVFSSNSSSKRSRTGASQRSVAASSTKTDSDDHGRYILSHTGSESFMITVSRLRLSFSTKLYVEQSCPYQIDNFLPASLTEKGRITLDEFNKFISDKMKSGRWNIVHLKLSHINGEADMSAYKRLYKEYESLDRICMINVTDSTKVFLVTPKFIRVCKCMSGVENVSRSSTYAVVLTKEKLLPSS